MNPEELMTALDDSRKFVETMTGIKAMFVEQGWDERTAEQMVYAMLTKS